MLARIEVELVAQTDDFALLTLDFVAHTQWRDEVIRPVMLFGVPTPQRTHEARRYPFTVLHLARVTCA